MTAPGRSSASRRLCGPCARDSIATTISTAPTGTLIRKTHLHDSAVVRTPPMIAPAMPPRPPAADQAPKARARSRSFVKKVLTTASVAGAIMAAPSPCAMRAATRTSGLVASPSTRLDAENMTSPPTSTRRWPNRSAARPPTSMNPAKVSRYPLTTQAWPVVEKSRSRSTEGSATLMMAASRITMNWQAQTSERTIQAGPVRASGNRREVAVCIEPTVVSLLLARTERLRQPAPHRRPAVDA